MDCLCSSTVTHDSIAYYFVGVACIENGITIQSDKRSGGWRNRSGRARDGGRHGVSSSDRNMGPDPYESDESISDDAMDIDNGNPNEF